MLPEHILTLGPATVGGADAREQEATLARSPGERKIEYNF